MAHSDENVRDIIRRKRLYDIGDALREKLGVTTVYRPMDMPEAIRSISGREPVTVPLAIQANGDYEPDEGIDGFEAVHSAVPTLEAVVTQNAIAIIGDAEISEDAVVLGGQYLHKRVTRNGVYLAVDDGAKAYSGVTVEVEVSTGEQVFTENGEYDAAAYGLDGFDHATVRVGAVAWMASAMRNTIYPFGIAEAALAMNALTWTGEADSDAGHPYAEVNAVFALNAFAWASEAEQS